MNEKEYEYAKGRLVGITESLNELSFKNKKEAMKILSDRMLYLSVSLQGITVHDEVVELKARLLVDFEDNKSWSVERQQFVVSTYDIEKIINEALKSLEENDN